MTFHAWNVLEWNLGAGKIDGGGFFWKMVVVSFGINTSVQIAVTNK